MEHVPCEVETPIMLIAPTQWEQLRNGDLSWIEAKWLSERIVITTQTGSAMSVFSVIPPADKSAKGKRHRAKTFGMFGGNYLWVFFS
jgi:hypothetical protein